MSTDSIYDESWKKVAEGIRVMGAGYGGVAHIHITTSAPDDTFQPIDVSGPSEFTRFPSFYSKPLEVEADYSVAIGLNKNAHVEAHVGEGDERKMSQHTLTREMLKATHTGPLVSILKNMLTEIGVPGMEGSFITLYEPVSTPTYTMAGVMDMMNKAMPSLAVPKEYFSDKNAVVFDSLHPDTMGEA